jgi:hypothetical protein
LTPAATWCGQCYLPRGAVAIPAQGAAPVVPQQGELSIMSGNRQQVAARPVVPMVKSRWRKTPTTFGPLGRVVWTVALVLPLAPMIVGTVVGIIPCVIGLGIWLFIIMPWALRDIWRAGQLPAG